MGLFTSTRNKQWKSGTVLLEDNPFWRKLGLKEEVAQDLRKATRISIKLPAYYRINGNGADWKAAQTVDYSQNGVRLLVHTPVCRGMKISIEVRLPGMQKPAQLHGVVIWVGPAFNRGTQAECGVAFEDLRRIAPPEKEKMTTFLADRLCQLALHLSRGLVCRPVESLEDLKEAYRLLYREYMARGYCQPNLAKMHYNLFCLLPDSCTFVLKRKDQLLGTISLLVDSPCGLPMESLFPEEIAKLRVPGRRLAEVGLLALNQTEIGKGLFSLANLQKQAALFRLFKTMFDYARFVAGVTDLVIGMHPKHEALYRYLTFETIGPVRSYEGACGNPALPMRMDIPKTEATVPKGFGKGLYYLRTPRRQSQEQLQKRYHLDAQAAHQLLLKERNLWDKLSPSCQAHLSSCYPGLIPFKKAV